MNLFIYFFIRFFSSLLNDASHEDSEQAQHSAPSLLIEPEDLPIWLVQKYLL